ncbi:MAG: helix-turn-helix domain-containing protein [Desulfurivibrionaceae bacterium]|jgi:hypothetical protein
MKEETQQSFLPFNKNYLPEIPSSVFTTEQTAVFLQVQPATLEQWRWNGRGPRFVKIGRSCRYRLADLEAFLAERVFSSTTEAQAGVKA